MMVAAIPGNNGSVGKGERQMNFVWYNNFLQGTQELEKVMTDTNVRSHKSNLRGQGRPSFRVIDALTL